MKFAYTWLTIAMLVLESTAGDILISRAMKQIGDLQQLRQRCGTWQVVLRVLSNRTFFAAIGCMALAFFSLLAALSWADVSVVGPASTSLSFLTTTLFARIILKERVDWRRWTAATFVAAGVGLLAS